MRRIDEAVGAPLIRLAALGRRRRLLPLDPRRILVLQPTAIGDTILSSGVVAFLAHRFPEARLLVLHGPSNAAAVALIDAPLESRTVRFTNPLTPLSIARRFRPDLVVDLTPWPRATALVARFAGGAAVGFDTPGQRRGRAFDASAAHRVDRHEIENLAAMARTLGLRGRYDVAIKRGLPAPQLNLPYARLVLCHPCAGGTRADAKAWPVGHWAAFAHACAARGLIAGFTGVAADAPIIDEIIATAGIPEAVSLAGRMNLEGLAGAIEAAAAVVSVDTGVLHLAAALGAPLIGLHGPTRAARWGAVSPAAISLDSPHPHAGGILLGFEPVPEGTAVMAALSVEAVVAALDALLTLGRGDGDPAPANTPALAPLGDPR